MGVHRQGEHHIIEGQNGWWVAGENEWGFIGQGVYHRDMEGQNGLWAAGEEGRGS